MLSLFSDNANAVAIPSLSQVRIAPLAESYPTGITLIADFSCQLRRTFLRSLQLNQSQILPLKHLPRQERGSGLRTVKERTLCLKFRHEHRLKLGNR